MLQSLKRAVALKLQHVLKSSEWLVKMQNTDPTLQSFWFSKSNVCLGIYIFKKFSVHGENPTWWTTIIEEAWLTTQALPQRVIRIAHAPQPLSIPRGRWDTDPYLAWQSMAPYILHIDGEPANSVVPFIWNSTSGKTNLQWGKKSE